MNWININDKLPEDSLEFLIEPNDDLMPLMTQKLIVLTDMGTVIDNKRLKMQIGKKEWVWFMGVEGETVTHWMIFEPPTNN